MWPEYQSIAIQCIAIQYSDLLQQNGFADLHDILCDYANLHVLSNCCIQI